MVADVDPLRLLHFLKKDIRPIATPSRWYGEDDAFIMRADVQKLFTK